MQPTTNHNAAVQALSMLDPADIIAVLNLEHEHCATEDCTAPTAGIAVGVTATGCLAVSPICKAHAEANAAVARAVEFDAYEVPGMLGAITRRTILKHIEADAFPFVARMPGALDHCGLFFIGVEGAPGFVPIVLPYEEGDRLVQHAPSLQYIVDALMDGKSLTMTGPTDNWRLMIVDTDLGDFQLYPTGEAA